MSNESIISIPNNVEEAGQLRLFLNKLVAQLDLTLGFRSDPAGNFSTNFQKSLTISRTPIGTIQEQIQNLLERIATLEDANTVIQSEISTLQSEVLVLQNSVADIQQGTSVASLSYSAFTADATYNQTQAQDLTDNLDTTSAKVNEILVVLQAAGITI